MLGLARSTFWADDHDSHGQIRGSPDDFATWMSSPGIRETRQDSGTSHSADIVGARRTPRPACSSSARACPESCALRPDEIGSVHAKAAAQLASRPD
jgi:hypothetical protein